MCSIFGSVESAAVDVPVTAELGYVFDAEPPALFSEGKDEVV